MVLEHMSICCARIIKSHAIYVRDRIDSGNLVMSVFLDFKKAFDTVDHHFFVTIRFLSN